ncbi:inner nuclear membrane protein Man1-like [Leptopilina heterotoma]|uniref:inner nuclear membrane protein Man1-like n=1 Tax=Leptopilina heterotoma TaxID=63436 RepID=UPI001CA919B9|nr:inner nuclear membrane protein Man1-like [Leptopilina heterotoma]
MSLDNLSDSELRKKLVEHGFPAGPVTHTTRNILIKKLKNLIEAKGSGASRHSLAARYSSDETDEDSSVATNRKKKATAAIRRQTLANPMPPPLTTSVVSSISSTSKSPVKKKEKSRNTESADSEYDNPSVSTSRIVKKPETPKVTKTYKFTPINDGLETGSDSDMPEEPEKVIHTAKFGDTGKSFEPRIQNQSIPDLGLSTKSSAHEIKTKPLYIAKDEKFSTPQFKNSSPIVSNRGDFTKDYGNTSTNKNDVLANFETPYLSEFTRRLSSRTSINVPSVSKFSPKSPYRQTNTTPEVSESDTNGHYSSSRPIYPSTSRYITSIMDRSREIVKRNVKPTAKTKDEMRNNQNIVSMILVIVLALFFGVLAIVYLGLGGKTETVPSLSADSNVPLCVSDLQNQNHPKVNCVLEENLGNVFDLLEKLQQMLMQKAVSSICDDSEVKPYLTDNDIIKLFKNQKVSEFEVKEDLYNAQILILSNPKWGMSLIEIDLENKGITEIVDTMEKLFSVRVAEKLGIQITNPALPMQCLIKRKVFTLFSSMLLIAFSALLIIGGHKVTTWYMQQKKKTEKEVFQLVSEIISMVEINHQNSVTSSPGGTQESYLAINHVRDNLIPPKNRKKLASTWEKAVKFLDENESRIRREVQQVAGEEYHVWRWLPSSSLNTSNTQNSSMQKKTKVWQGQAFETMEGSVNSPLSSPTPCLKIRNMFKQDGEFEDDWETKVKDAILEKCGEGVNIFHINVDRGSREGCVYMKCMSKEDAGKAYRALHGCWYDGRLVTVKYLRLERYHERFPDAVYFTTPLKPSNNQRLSLQSNYWQTPMEAN